MTVMRRLRTNRRSSAPDRLGTISLPSGTSETGISLRLASASGMPMIVMAIATAVTTWPMASQMPNRMTQMTLPISAPGRGSGLVDDRAAERPQRVGRDAQRRESERDRDDQDEADERRQQVAQRQPQAAEDQPDDVQDQAHLFLQRWFQPTE